MSTDNADATPSPDWTTWALLQAALKDDPHRVKAGTLGHMCVIRLQQLAGMNPDLTLSPGPCCFLIMTNSGYWSRGTTLEDAAKECVKTGCLKTAKVFGYLFLNDATPEVNQAGQVISDSKSLGLGLGPIGTIGSILNAAKS